jgi:hypothetical protein
MLLHLLCLINLKGAEEEYIIDFVAEYYTTVITKNYSGNFMNKNCYMLQLQ